MFTEADFMLDIAVAFLADEFNAYLQRRTGSLALGRAVPGALVNDAGKVAVDKGTVGVALINIEEERVTRVQQPERVLVNGREIVLPPELRLNLTLMFVPNMATYELSLRALSHVLSFFQACPAFSVDEYPALDARIGQLLVELHSIGPETLNQVWACLGAKYMPSVLYRVRLVTLQDQEPAAIGAPITDISLALHEK